MYEGGHLTGKYDPMSSFNFSIYTFWKRLSYNTESVLIARVTKAVKIYYANASASLNM